MEFDDTSAAPRSAILLCRRAVLSIRLDPKGRATEASWAYLTPDAREFVAMDVGEHRVTLVREDGQILQLSRRSGEELDRIRGGERAHGALVLDADRPADAAKAKPPKREQALHQVAQVILDDDARLLPAQRLVADLLWRDEDPWVRAAVIQIAQAEVRTESTDAAEALRRHALDLMSGPWGRPNEAEARTLLAELGERPSFLDGERPPAAVLARRAVQAGDASMIPHLVAHLLHPGTAAADLPEIVAALDDLDAVDGLATFVRRYHADPAALYESGALLGAVDVLVDRSRFTPTGEEDDEPRARLARTAWTTLSEIAEDPFTEAALRDYIADRLPEAPAGVDAVELVDDDEPQLTALSHPGL